MCILRSGGLVGARVGRVDDEAIFRLYREPTSRALSGPVVACFAVVAALGLSPDGAAAQDIRPPLASPGVVAVDAMPSDAQAQRPGKPTPPAFLDAAALARLQQSLAPPRRAEADDRRAASSSRAFVLGSGLASVLPDLRLPTFDVFDAFSDRDATGTLQQARRDAGEVRLLSEEVRSRAEELSRRFAVGGWGEDGAVTPPDAAPSQAATAATSAANDTTFDPFARAVTAVTEALTPAKREQHEGRMSLGHGGSEAGAERRPQITEGASDPERPVVTETPHVATRKVTTIAVPAENSRDVTPASRSEPASKPARVTAAPSRAAKPVGAKSKAAKPPAAKPALKSSAVGGTAREKRETASKQARTPAAQPSQAKANPAKSERSEAPAKEEALIPSIATALGLGK